jgi:hypothetical protein
LAINRGLNVPRCLQSKDSKKLTRPAAAKFVIFFFMPHAKEMAECRTPKRWRRDQILFAYQVSEHPHAACGWLRA